MKNEAVAAAAAEEEEVEINTATITTLQHRPKRTTIQINRIQSHPINNNPVKTPRAPQKDHHPRITIITLNKNSRTKVIAAITHSRINPLQVISHNKTRHHLKRHQRHHIVKTISRRLVKTTKKRKTNRG